MLKALLKKQLLEIFSRILRNRKTGKRRSRLGMIAVGVGFVLLFLLLGGCFGLMLWGLLDGLKGMGLIWLYYTFAALLAVLMGTFGSVFNTYASLYQARDNRLLLSMPIPPRLVLAARLVGVWLMGLLFESLAFVPAMVVRWILLPVNAAAIICPLLVWLALSFFILTLSAILGWVVGRIAGRLRHKSLVTVIVSLAFFGAYYALVFRSDDLLSQLIENASQIGQTFRGSAWPLYAVGTAAAGSLPYALGTLGVCLLLLALCAWVMSRTFLKMATATQKTVRRTYTRGVSRASTPGRALLRKEFRRLTGSPTYMLNACLGTVMMPIAAVFLMLKRDSLQEVLGILPPFIAAFLPVFAAALVCLMSSMNTISAPSVSLEGKNIWLLQSLPVSPRKVLGAKALLHFLVTWPPMLILGVCLSLALKLTPAGTALLLLAGTLFVLLIDLAGLTCNLLLPNLHWTNETYPIKQSAAVAAALFGGWLVVALLGVLCYLTRNLLTPMVFLACAATLLLAVDLGLGLWLRTRGARRFATLK